MTLRLITFGALELRDEHGNVLAGAASQAKPLLILALAALHPHGISRSRLSRALWPGTPTDRAKATLKQHLYALRRATGDPELITGTPMLRVASGRITVDALELEAAVERGDLRGVASLVQGELLEEIGSDAGSELSALIAELRARFAPALALVAAAGRLGERIGTSRSVPISIGVLGAGRELEDAVRSTLRSWRTLPADHLAAELRAGATFFQVAEVLRVAGLAGVPDEELSRAVAPLRNALEAVEPIRPFVERSGAAAPDPVVLVDWAMADRPLSGDPTARALEGALLASPIGSQLRARARWLNGVVRERVASAGARGCRILALDCRWWDRFPPLAAGDWTASVELVAIGPASDPETVGIEAMTVVQSDDPLLDVLSLDGEDRFDLVVVGSILDGHDFRELGRELGAVFRLVSPGGAIAFDLASDRSWCEVARHLLGIDWRATDLEALTILAGRLADGVAPVTGRDPDGARWHALVAAAAADPSDDESQVASVGIAEP